MSKEESEQLFYDKGQTYWKWLLSINTRRLPRPVFFIWMTDKTADEMADDIDKLILTKTHQIVGAYDHLKLFQYLRDHKEELPDPVNTITWLNEVSVLDAISVSEHDIYLIEDALEGGGFNKASVNESINFINLFNDLAYQLEDDGLFEISRKRQIRDLWNFGYDNIFWKEWGHEEIPAVRIPQFSTNHKLLNRRMNLMIDTFISRIEIIDSETRVANKRRRIIRF